MKKKISIKKKVNLVNELFDKETSQKSSNDENVELQKNQEDILNEVKEISQKNTSNDFDNFINNKYLQILSLIKRKNEQERIMLEKIKVLKEVCSKLNNILGELNVYDTEFFISDIYHSEKIKEILNDNVDNELSNILYDIVYETNKQYEDAKKFVSIHKIVNYKRMITSPSLSSTTDEIGNEIKAVNIKSNKTHIVETAILSTELENVLENIQDLVGETIFLKKYTGGKFINFGEAALPKPDNIQIDYENIKDYVNEHQHSGRLIFKSERDAKIWRCLTFDDNYGKRPYGLYILKDQKLF